MSPAADDPAELPAPAGATSTARRGRTLVLLRHAKAVTHGGGVDLGRALSVRGTSDATAAGTWLAQAGLHADMVVCSPSVRTRETWQAAVEGGASATAVEEDRRVYEAGADELLDVLRETSSEVQVLVLVGHAPGVPALATMLADPATSDADAVAAVRQKYPTNGLCRLEYDGAWADLGPAGAALIEFAVPRA